MSEENDKFSILFVDDEKNILSSLKRLFRSEGYEIHIGNSGQEGLELLESNNIDVVVSDMRMPNMDGAEFLKIVSNNWPSTIRILLTGYADISSTIAAVNEGNIYKYISKPWEDNDLKITIKNALKSKKIEKERDRLLTITRTQNDKLKELNENLEQIVEKRTFQLKLTLDKITESNLVLKNNFLETVKVFTNVIDLREGNVKGHSKNVAEDAKLIALGLGMNDDEAQQVLLAGLLHDIGKVVLPDLIISRPYRSLSNEEKEKFSKHSEVGQNMLKSLDSFREISEYVRSHHELYNGSGYPDGLKGGQIPLGGRILCVVNEFWSLQQGTLLSQKHSLTQALEYISRHKGDRYDPKVVNLLLKNYGKGPLIDKESKNYRTVPVKTFDLRPGMKIDSEIRTRDGIVLLKGGNRLDVSAIKKMKNYEKESGEKLNIVVRVTLKDANDPG